MKIKKSYALRKMFLFKLHKNQKNDSPITLRTNSCGLNARGNFESFFISGMMTSFSCDFFLQIFKHLMSNLNEKI